VRRARGKTTRLKETRLATRANEISLLTGRRENAHMLDTFADFFAYIHLGSSGRKEKKANESQEASKRIVCRMAVRDIFMSYLLRVQINFLPFSSFLDLILKSF